MEVEMDILLVSYLFCIELISESLKSTSFSSGSYFILPLRLEMLLYGMAIR
ncbi:hypothetical protein ABID52_000635 [Fictibacillus halophilus]|uniref:Uncharacterized protein n=1 Tax=Fictibacillus halophilus TaxID=1610490 RepID=A0ABV2LEQ4_9BACL|nr:hypothetical protein [Fictibacillus halophilus]